MPGVRLGRWAAAAAALASVAVPVCTSGHHPGRSVDHRAEGPADRYPDLHPDRYQVQHPDQHAGRHTGAALPERAVPPVLLPAGHRSRDEARIGNASRPARTELTVGLLSNATATEGVSRSLAQGARYVEGSNVLRLASGRWTYLPDAGTVSDTVDAGHPPALRQIERSRAWLAAGGVPGASPAHRAAAERALLSLRALLRPNGAMAAGASHGWQYSWPRDSSFACAAFALTGHDAEAHRILRHSAATQRADGTWEARTELDGSGPPDGRRWQLDANGWVPWATWQWYQSAPRATRGGRLAALYPMIRKAADHAADSLRPDGLPPASPDYWELMTATANIGTAAPLLAGLNASADLAREAGRPADAERWARAAGRLSAGISARFLPLGYQRTADGRHGRDSAVAFMAPPFNEAPAGLARALDSTYGELLLPNGGLTPGNDPGAPWGGNAWTPSTAFFALAWAATGRPAKAGPVLDWVLSKRNSLGELPEKVDKRGRPSSVAPLAWTASIAVLTLVALDGTVLPTPPLRG
ncbi:glycoside hydrolase family 15 [Streptomyces sp. ICC4]|uniref:glycoside hydrolase family 15 n=1 Tax=Streptomyces sp. ICC4 TaxID=2099584 RepID=UPI000DC7D337|nr:glycoside hydrolase family 15 [Streptomyces sp. ICC4]AWZ06008.1 glycoside hydrolase family 15 [Streptomyces sp. ICC4]